MSGMEPIPGIGKNVTDPKKRGELPIGERWESDEETPVNIQERPIEERRARG